MGWDKEVPMGAEGGYVIVQVGISNGENFSTT